MLYANYLRNKMHHLVKAVFASGYPLKIISKFNRTAIDYTIHGKTEIGKNLIPFPYAFFGSNSTKNINGITFTDNGDGSITANGTSTLSSYFELILSSDIIDDIDKTKTYTMSVTGAGKPKVDIELALFKNNAWVENVCTLSRPTTDFSTYDKEFNQARVVLLIGKNASFENVVIKPMLEIGNTATEYEPYTEYGVGDAVTDNESFNYKIPLVNTGKNLLPYPFYQTTKTTNGITFTDNGDGTITANGTATAQASFTCLASPIPKGKCCVSGCPAGGSNQTYHMWINATKNGVGKGVTDIGAGGVLDTRQLDYNTSRVYCIIEKDTTVNNLVFKPMLELGDTATEYEPYRTGATTNVYCVAQLKDGESISYRADDLPELQLYKGENNITADTTINPTSIDIKYLN